MQVMAKYLQNVQSRMVVSLMMARVLGLMLLALSGMELYRSLGDGDVALALMAFTQLYHLTLGLMLLTLAIRLVKQVGQMRLFSVACRQMMVMLARLGLLAAFLVKPCGVIVISAVQPELAMEITFLKFVMLVDWPVVVLAGLLHLMAGLQKLGSEMNAEQELTI
ncbi:hypothetical protein KUV56_17005 [Ferrimonas balearica]|uniref:hypothetical protein n=1 Tax=Ferrimonas balearica TaxID=44012 RepID=UPI001C55ED09|nr:hypothetical protein [Ferrimonas balearica]MBW3141198.1 hypothetical protein [Ferrimonas balearica]MBY6108231.1 hypothetical protein [Ferrimonas balearica]